jgi:hypothetical protein
MLMGVPKQRARAAGGGSYCAGGSSKVIGVMPLV